MDGKEIKKKRYGILRKEKGKKGEDKEKEKKIIEENIIKKKS